MLLPKIKWQRHLCVLFIFIVILYAGWLWLVNTTKWPRDFSLSAHALKIFRQKHKVVHANYSGLAALRKQCNFLEHIKAGKEGEEVAGHRLRAALLLVRHGDRGPLLPFVRDLSTIDCGVPAGLSPRLSAIYRNYSHLALDRAAANWRGATLGSFSRTPLLPAALCRAGRLSQRGLLQLLKLGDQLQQRYVPLLAGAAPLLYFAPSERGLQSAAALGFGLAGQSLFRAGAGWLRVTRDADLCLSGCGLRGGAPAANAGRGGAP